MRHPIWLGCVAAATITTASIGQETPRDRAARGLTLASVRADRDAPQPPARPRDLVIGEDGVARPAVADDAAAVPADPSASCQRASPLSAAEIEALVAKVAREEDGDPRLAVAVARQESGFDRRRVSAKGALGTMQLMPGTAAMYGLADPCEPEANIRAGVKHLNKLTREFGNPFLVLAAYNAGEGRIYEHKGLPPFKETLNFVARIANDYYGFADGLDRRKGSAPPRAASAAVQGLGAPAPLPASDPDASRWVRGHVLNLD